MAKDYAKFVPPKSRLARKNKWRVGYVMVFILLLLGAMAAGCFVYIDKTATMGARAERVKTVMSKIVAWAQHKKIAVKPAAPVAVANNQPPPVHFDFYNELPNMQMPADEPKSVASAPPAFVPKPTPAESAPTNPAPAVVKAETPTAPVVASTVQATPIAPENMDTTVTPTVAKIETVATPEQSAKAAFDVDDVDHLLATEQKAVVVHQAQRYVVQLGVFQSEIAANTLRDAVTSVGFHAAVVPVKHGNRNLYHVQQGPYESVAAAKQLQQQLGKRGIISIIQKASA